MVKLFLAKRLKPEGADIRLIDPERKTGSSGGTLYKALPPDFSMTGFTLVPDIADADFILIPQGVKRITPNVRRYLEEVCAAARAAGKQAILFLSGDLSFDVHAEIPNLIVFKASAYGRTLRGNEVVFAPFTEDLGAPGVPPLRRKGEKPVVSFCGFAGLPKGRSLVKYRVMNALLSLASTLDPRFSAKKRGIWFRREAMRVLAGDSRIQPLFIVRDTFGGNAATVADPDKTRREYLESIRDTDLVLCPKGDGNYSSRFYETLSLGRIPLLIDTDMVLPFERSLDYETFTLRVPHTELPRLAEHIARWWDALTDEQYAAMQTAARTTYRESLRYDAYFGRALPLLKEGGIGAVL